MLNNESGKEILEENHLSLFLDAYQTVTGIALSIRSRGESPDFICAYPSGEFVGVELTRSPHDHDMVIDDRIWNDRTLPAFDLLESVNAILAVKERKRQSRHWRIPQNTILVIELIDYSFESLTWADDTSLAEGYLNTGFLEVWLADYSTLEAYGQVRLIGLYPLHYWGVHYQPALERKPYG